jgi:hypothetical protein
MITVGAGAFTFYRWYEAMPYVQVQRLAEARARWEARTFGSDYRLHYAVQSNPTQSPRQSM